MDKVRKRVKVIFEIKSLIPIIICLIAVFVPAMYLSNTSIYLSFLYAPIATFLIIFIIIFFWNIIDIRIPNIKNNKYNFLFYLFIIFMTYSILGSLFLQWIIITFSFLSFSKFPEILSFSLPLVGISMTFIYRLTLYFESDSNKTQNSFKPYLDIKNSNKEIKSLIKSLIIANILITLIFISILIKLDPKIYDYNSISIQTNIIGSFIFLLIEIFVWSIMVHYKEEMIELDSEYNNKLQIKNDNKESRLLLKIKETTKYVKLRNIYISHKNIYRLISIVFLFLIMTGLLLNQSQTESKQVPIKSWILNSNHLYNNSIYPIDKTNQPSNNFLFSIINDGNATRSLKNIDKERFDSKLSSYNFLGYINLTIEPSLSSIPLDIKKGSVITNNTLDSQSILVFTPIESDIVYFLNDNGIKDVCLISIYVNRGYTGEGTIYDRFYLFNNKNISFIQYDENQLFPDDVSIFTYIEDTNMSEHFNNYISSIYNYPVQNYTSDNIKNGMHWNLTKSYNKCLEVNNNSREI